MKKSLTIYVIDGTRDVKFEFSVIPMQTVDQVKRKLGLERFSLIKVTGKTLDGDLDIFGEVEDGGKLLALWNGDSEGDLPDDD